jgi:hypothetical protein
MGGTVKDRFTAVVHGTFETTRTARPALAVVLLGTAALVSWLATVLVDLAITAAGVAAAVIAACWLVSRRSDRDAQLLAERTAAMHAEVTAARTVPQVVHYHLHLPAGATAEEIRAALPHGD